MDTLSQLAGCYQALADPIRLRILGLVQSGAPSATDINRSLDMSQPRVAHHIKILVAAGLVRAERDGRFVRYRPPESGRHRDLFDVATTALAGTEEQETLRAPEREATRPEPGTARSTTRKPAAREGTLRESDDPEPREEIEDFLL